MAVQTPRDVAVRISVYITLVVTVILFLYDLAKGDKANFGLLTIAAALTFVSSFVLSSWAVEKFIYQKVKIIYKTIHRFKSQREKRKDISMNEDVMTKVNNEVMVWAEGKIEEISQLKEQDSFRRDFIGNLAHEIKTPVFNIQGYILTLLEGALEDEENNRKFLMKAARNVDRIVTLIEDLDQITRIEGGRYQLHETRFDIVELAKEVIESLEQKAKKANVRLRLKNANEKPIQVVGDRPKIEQVFINLVANSINYGAEDGETRIRFYDMEDNILVEVADNGIGISEDHLPRIFERFYRVDKSRSRHGGGSGLGLSIVKHIIDVHDQTINVRSSPDLGTTFSFTLEKA
ncbi:MAG: ATP-binding protein [Flavobacteriales bacterium]|nr:ATP-binding protein [Flavobacteriales bacterium]